MSLKLVIANKCYSSWSMRPWLVMRAFGVPFDELVVPLRTAQTKEMIARLSPSGKVPVLIDGDALVWESLAIIEYLAEKFPQVAIWPKDVRPKAARLDCGMNLPAISMRKWLKACRKISVTLSSTRRSLAN